jgi:nitrilase
MFVIGVNPCIHADQIPESIPRREALYPPGDRERENGWLLPGNTIIVDPTGTVLAGPVEEEERIVTAELDLSLVATTRRFFDPVGHYNRPDVFRLAVDTRARPAVVETEGAFAGDLRHDPADPVGGGGAGPVTERTATPESPIAT